MDKDIALQVLDKFKVNINQSCRECGLDDVAFKVDHNIYCCYNCYDDCYTVNEYDHCVACQSVNTYCYIDINDYGIYNRICKKCFMVELDELIDSPCTIKPAKH